VTGPQHNLYPGGRVSPSYELSRAEVGELCRDFLTGHEKPVGRLGSYVISPDTIYSNLGRSVESAVFDESFRNTPDIMASEYGPYESASTFFVVIDHEQEMPVGTMRLIANSDAGLKSLVDLPRTPLGIVAEDVYQAYAINPDRCIDVSTLALLPEYRRQEDGLSRLLVYRPLYKTVINNPNFDHIVTIVDEQAQRSLWALRFPLRRIFDSQGFPYLGSKQSYAMYAQTSDFKPQMNYWISKFWESGSHKRQQVGNWMKLLIEDDSPLDELIRFTDQNSAEEIFKLHS